MLSEITMTTPVGATLTEAELFGCLIDAPVRNSDAVSTLNVTHESDWCMKDAFPTFFDSLLIDDAEMPLNLLENLRECDEPAEELDIIISDLENLVDSLRTLRREFKYLMTATLQRPEETGDDELDKAAGDEWDKRPRGYVLPVSVALKSTPQH